MKIPAAVLTALRQHQSFLTHTHTGPDPDSFGATLALKIALEEQGKVVTIFGEDKLIPAAYFLPGSDQILQISLSQALATYPFDCYISLDTASASMISKNLPLPEIHAPFVNLDHHPDNTLPKQLSFIDPAASSACEVLFQVLTAANIPISPSAATCLLFGILGDSVVFQSSATTPATLRLAADLIDLGGDYHGCVTVQTRSYDALELKNIGHLLSRLELSPDNLYVLYKLNYDQYQQLGAQLGIGVFSNFFANKVASTKFSLVLIEKEPNLTTGSLRSRDPDFDVSQIAHLLGGGGHKNAAAFRLEKPLASAEKDFLSAIAYLQSKGKL